MDTGLIDYIRVNAPFAMSMPAARYDDYFRLKYIQRKFIFIFNQYIQYNFRAPWASCRGIEEKHRKLTAGIGTLLKG